MTQSHFSRATELLASARVGLKQTYDLTPEQAIGLDATIGTGYAMLAVAEALDELLHEDLSLQEQDQLRQRRAAAEAPPHDDRLVPVPCPRCEGCGQLADTDDREPWTAWENLPPGSDLAVKAGLVKPVPCDQCDGEKTVLRRPSADPGDDRG
ncbi:hypothetical protein [Amycolatopsis sp. NPDC051128]|uniref:hypothetical protein n=1 Tax=Amycolatopsis sp. NPDC051128 TaxID=3155412 RepID=UPI00342772E8